MHFDIDVWLGNLFKEDCCMPGFTAELKHVLQQKVLPPVLKTYPCCHVHCGTQSLWKAACDHCCKLHLGGAKLLLSFSPHMQVWRGTFWIQQRAAPRSFPETAE